MKFGDYNLYAVIVHKGEEISSGHYTAYTYTKQRGWCFYDDDNGCSVTKQQAMTNSRWGYIFFYRIDPSKVHQESK